MSVITCLITLLSYLHIAHCYAHLSGCLCVFSAWSFTIPFNDRSPIMPEKLIADPNFSMLCGILANACILGKFHLQPSSLGKHSVIRLMRMPRAFEDCLTCDLACGSLTQHLNDKYSFGQYLNFFKEIVLSFISFHINFCPEWVCMTQSNTKQLPTHLVPHILVPSVIQFRIDMHGKSLSLCCSALLTKQWSKSSNDSLSLFSNWGLQSNYQDNQTCVWVSQCHWHVTFLQEQILVIHTSGHQKGHFQKHWKCFFA